MLDQHEIDRMIDHHPPQDDETVHAHEAVRGHVKELMSFLNIVLPTSRERSIAMTDLQKVMWAANAAIAIYGPTEMFVQADRADRLDAYAEAVRSETHTTHEFTSELTEDQPRVRSSRMVGDVHIDHEIEGYPLDEAVEAIERLARGEDAGMIPKSNLASYIDGALEDGIIHSAAILRRVREWCDEG